jgi:hypothetical protein
MSPEAEAELRALQEVLAGMNAKIDGLDSAVRRKSIELLRSNLQRMQVVLTAEDEKLFEAFERSDIGFDRLVEHFQGRVTPSDAA